MPAHTHNNVGQQTRKIVHCQLRRRRDFAWLERELGDREWFNGDTFGWGDLSVVPYVNGSAGHGHAPSGKLGDWLARANAARALERLGDEDQVLGARADERCENAAGVDWSPRLSW